MIALLHDVANHTSVLNQIFDVSIHSPHTSTNTTMSIEKIFENNTKYAAWWCTTLGDKIEQVVSAVKKNDVTPNTKFLVRVKLYNIVTSRIEEVRLSDLLVAAIQHAPKEVMSPKDPDDKNQVQFWGPYFISFPIYEHVRLLYVSMDP